MEAEAEAEVEVEVEVAVEVQAGSRSTHRHSRPLCGATPLLSLVLGAAPAANAIACSAAAAVSALRSGGACAPLR